MIGEMIDELYDLRSARLAMEKEVEVLKGHEATMQREIHKRLQDTGLDKASGHKANFSYKTEIQPVVNDWNAYFDYVSGQKAWPLIQKRVGVTAWKEYRNSGILVPGSSEVEIPKYSITKR